LLMLGATLVPLPAEIRLDVESIPAFLQAKRIDVIDFTPSQLSLLLQLAKPARLPSFVLVGGEAIEPALWTQLRRFKDSRVFNVYGPTEATVDTLLCPLSEAGEVPVLGWPVSNARVHLLDAHGRLVAQGLTGEIHIAGAGLARGYLHHPELTAERFVPDPFGSGGSRMYRTGDLARRRADGAIEFLGRTDHQVKIRGYRVELGEIEAALGMLPQVRHAAVAVHVVGAERALVAYLVAPMQDAASVRASLLESLPEHLVPSRFMFLDALPLNANGKVDRAALPPPPTDAANQSHVAPRNESERQMAGLWEAILEVAPIGVHDHFFRLGGHSLLAVRLLHQVRQHYGVDVPLGAIFASPTLGEFTAKVVTNLGGDERLVPLRAGDEQAPLFCIHPTGGKVSAYQMLADALGVQRPVIGVQASDNQRFDSVDQLAADHAAALCERQPEGPFHLLGWSSGGVLAQAVAAALEAQGRAVAYVGLIDSMPMQKPQSSPPDQGLNEVLLGMLASLRGRSFSDQELAELEADLEQRGVRVTQLARTDVATVAPLLAKWTGISTDPQLFSFLRDQASRTMRDRRLMTGYTPQPVRASLHACVASESVARHLHEVHGRQMEFDRVGGDHYSMLRAPHVASLAQRISARLASAGT